MGEVLNPAHAFAGHGRGQQKAAAGSSRRTFLEAGPKAPRGWRGSCAARGHNSHTQTQPSPLQPIPTNPTSIPVRRTPVTGRTNAKVELGSSCVESSRWTMTGARTRTRTRTTRQSQISRRLQSRTLSASVPHHAPISTSPRLTAPNLLHFTSLHFTSLHFTSGSSLQLAAGHGLANSAGPSSASLHRSPSPLLAWSTRTQPPVLCKDEGIILAVSKAGTPIFSMTPGVASCQPTEYK